jgi:hypothetical protein
METIKERVASAMNEVEQLQRKINDIIERQSLYTASRPSTAHSMARTIPGKLTDCSFVPFLILHGSPTYAVIMQKRRKSR